MCTLYRIFKKHLNLEKYIIIYTSYRAIMYDFDICTLCNLDTRCDVDRNVLICPFLKQNKKIIHKTLLLYKTKFIKVLETI